MPLSDEAQARTAVVEIIAARKAGDHDVAVARAVDLWAQFAASEEVGVARQVAIGTVYRGISLYRTGRVALAAVAYDDVIARYASWPDPELERIVSDARDMRQSCHVLEQPIDPGEPGRDR